MPHRGTLCVVRRHTSQERSVAIRPLIWLIAFLSLVLVGAGVTLWHFQDKPLLPALAGSDEVRSKDSGQPATPSPAPTPTDVSFSILAGGDLLPHIPVHNSARTGAGYDFSPLLAGIDPWIEHAGLSLCHMEVPIVPDGQKISGFPMFAASPDITTGLVTQGWNGCSTASNHSVDRKFAGVAATLDRFDDAGLGHVGTARTAQESQTPQVYTVTVDGLDTVIAHLSATYGTNGLPIPPEQPWSVQLIDAEQLIAQARAARSAGADLVLASIHAGNEYQTSPTQEQVHTATALAASGEIDLMIGHHAHVPQPMTKITGGPNGNGMWVAYGLGNMLSNQGTHCCVAQTNSGLLLSAQVTHGVNTPATISSLHWIGITVDRLDGHRLHALADIQRLPDGIGKLSAAEISARYERVKTAVGPEVPEQVKPDPAQAITVAAQRRAAD